MALARAIGRFDIEAEAASGAAGTVYQAIDRTNGVRVAMKVLRGVARADTARFSREARILSQIKHAGVVRYIDHGYTDEGNAYLVMEWLDGEDVRRRLVRTGLSMAESVALGLRVAEALVVVHEQGLVHRDIKPANIFLPSGLVAEAKIIDFGLVHTAWASMEVTRTGMVVGTPSYMAPEQARGQRAIDPRADIFSLGCVLYRCLAGRAPFEGKSVLAVLTKVLLEDAPPLHTLRADVPPELEELVMRMLRKDPAERPASAAATAAALAALAPVGGPDDLIEPAAPSHVLAGLTAGEQRVAAVVLIGADTTTLGDTTRPPGHDTSPAADATLPAGGDDGGAGRDQAGSHLREVVEQHGGQLDFLLDGTRIVTIVDASVATDEAARAARCALAVRAALPRVPIAIATGRKHVGAGEPSGNAIERAAELLAVVSRGDSVRPPAPARRSSRPPAAGIAIDEVTAALLDARFDVALAGGEHRLLGVRVIETAARTLLGKVTPMVGREWELRTIRSMFRTVVEEREARAVLVTGAAGMGKSRLAHEAVTALRDDYPDAEVWTGRADPLRASSALGLLGNILHSAVGIHESDPIDARRTRVAERVLALVPAGDAAWMASVLGEVAGVPFPEDDDSQGHRTPRRDARVVNEQIRAAWEALVAGACRGWPLLLVLEDLQWADTATIRLLGTALANLERRPWGVLALARPEVHDTYPRLWNAQNLQEIRLAPLTRRAGERLVRETLGSSVGANTVERIAAQADGNAFYLEELIRRHHDGGGSKPPPNPPGLSPGAVGGGGGLHGGALPETVLAMVQARLEGLDAGTRRILRAASIFGEVFWAGGVTALLGGSEPQAGWIDVLVRRELVAMRPESRFAGERDVAFRHALLREGAYAMLTPGDRALGHRLAAAWLEQQGEPDAMVLAQHFEIGQDALRAGELYREAAEQALRVANFDAAVRRAKQALAHAEKEPAADRLACLDVLCEAHVWRGDSADVAACVDAILPLAPRGIRAVAAGAGAEAGRRGQPEPAGPGPRGHRRAASGRARAGRGGGAGTAVDDDRALARPRRAAPRSSERAGADGSGRRGRARRGSAGPARAARARARMGGRLGAGRPLDRAPRSARQAGPRRAVGGRAAHALSPALHRREPARARPVPRGRGRAAEPRAHRGRRRRHLPTGALPRARPRRARRRRRGARPRRAPHHRRRGPRGHARRHARGRGALAARRGRRPRRRPRDRRA